MLRFIGMQKLSTKLLEDVSFQSILCFLWLSLSNQMPIKSQNSYKIGKSLLVKINIDIFSLLFLLHNILGKFIAKLPTLLKTQCITVTNITSYCKKKKKKEFQETPQVCIKLFLLLLMKINHLFSHLLLFSFQATSCW